MVGDVEQDDDGERDHMSKRVPLPAAAGGIREEEAEQDGELRHSEQPLGSDTQ